MRGILLSSLLMILHLAATAQTSADIDKIFKEFDSKDRPALASVILHQGEVVYQKAFGSELLGSDRPTTVNSRFHVAQLSRHFIAFGILLLEEQGQLSLGDDIRKYIPQLPPYKHTVRVRHLLEQTSGLPDLYTLKLLTGWGEDEPFTIGNTLELVGDLPLAYEPGTDYQYSDTDEVLLSLIISKVSGTPYADWMSKYLFTPLGMINTTFSEITLPLADRVLSYQEDPSGQLQIAEVLRPINLYSSIADLTLWELHLANPRVGSKNLVSRLSEVVKITDGNDVYPSYGRYTYGQRYKSAERGIPEMYRIGSCGGFSSAIFSFPDHEISVIILSAGMGYSGYLGIRAIYLFLEDEFPKPDRVNYEQLKLRPISGNQLRAYEGKYWDIRGQFSREITLENDTLRYVRPGQTSSLLPVGEDKFQMIMPYDEEVFVSFTDAASSESRMHFQLNDSNPSRFRSIAPDFKVSDLTKFEGIFIHPELQLTFQIQAEANRLIAKNVRSGNFSLTPIEENLFEGDRWYFRSITFKEDPDGKITGFDLFSEGSRTLNFRKVPSM